ncbi:lantibiotic dehydratase [Frankia sp. KB5]|uniref:lantibiotic dehydratase n=1 Tax=Frankia sp. KB5 TaxID=683318 RepID=UPI000A11853F|nr:lantibiotic dehydratase [Frankia sp. KB5]ORT46826.1 hypothetical protein KBI5_23090 [Frankia sp. KB5]
MVGYRTVDVAVLRATARHGAPPSEDWPDLAGHAPDRVSQWTGWLRRAWDDELADAVELASPALAAAVRGVLAAERPDPERTRRAVASVVTYQLRAATRPTPFGHFAGVAPARLGQRTAVDGGDAHRSIFRPDGGWLSTLVSLLETDHAVWPALAVTANTLAYLRADQIVVPSRPVTDRDGGVTLADAEIRATGAVRAALGFAREPCLAADLAARLTAAVPAAAPGAAERLVGGLLAAGALVSGLRPPADATDPLRYLLDRLAALPDQASSPLYRQVADVAESLAAHSAAAARRDWVRTRDAAEAAMTALHAQPGPLLAADLLLDITVTVPPVVAREAAAAAATLVRLTPYPCGGPAWSQWHTRFLDRWGEGAVVPLADAIHPDRGLGYPAGYRDGPPRRPAPGRGDRNRALLHLAQRAVLDGGELVLDGRMVDELAAAAQPPHTPDPVGHTELRVAVHAATPQAVDRGEFTLLVVNASRGGGTSIGRFLGLFDPATRTRIGAALAALPTQNAGATLAQLSCPPLMPRTMPLVAVPAVAPLLSLGEHRPPDGRPHIDIDDLAVTADTRRMRLVRLSTGQTVEPVALHALDFEHATQPLARFLCEISTARAATCVPFQWGAATALPVLPRVRHGRTVLAPARWMLTGADLPSRDAAQPVWDEAWAALRDRWRVPDRVLLGERDVVIGLDLDIPAHRTLLRSALDRRGSATLTEGPAPDAYDWIGGRPHEIALPLARTDAPAWRVAPARPVRPVAHPGQLPAGGRRLAVRLVGNARWRDTLLTARLPALLADWPDTDWWYLRDDTDEPSLRLFLRHSNADRGEDAAARVANWAAPLRHDGLIHTLLFDTYRPAIGQYGEGPILTDAETVFAADSAAALAGLAVASGPAGPDRQAVTAAGMVNLAAAFTGGRDTAALWLTSRILPSGPRISREHRDQGLALLTDAAVTDPLTHIWAARHRTIDAYRHRIATSNTADDTAPNPDVALDGLLRGHHARMIGTDPRSETACLRLARAIAVTGTRIREPAASGQAS